MDRQLWETIFDRDAGHYRVFRADSPHESMKCDTWIDAIHKRNLMRVVDNNIAECMGEQYIEHLAQSAERWPDLPERAKAFAANVRAEGILSLVEGYTSELSDF